MVLSFSLEGFFWGGGGGVGAGGGGQKASLYFSITGTLHLQQVHVELPKGLLVLFLKTDKRKQHGI